jgi:hypothetical protein
MIVNFSGFSPQAAICRRPAPAAFLDGVPRSYSKRSKI